ncbi:MAG: RsmB/NOP family class I SAM-dependent RNA methyltransferase [Promethearchaeota archaeon]|nr:MAG: RsmB/NOP family class I SAM-dependent RNA methyltransferase [Candidatus Lokiarchaeota archaeon]
MRKKALTNIISNLISFLKEKPVSPGYIRRDKTTHHYYTEIVRYWNKINFVLSYSASALKLKGNLNFNSKSIFSIIIYRYFWENASLREILTEFEPLYSESRSQINKNQIRAFYNKLKTFSWKKAFSNKSKLEKISIIKAIPSFFLKKLAPFMNEEFLINNIDTMNNYNTGDIAVKLISPKNRGIKTLMENFQQYLIKTEIPFELNPHIKFIINIPYNRISDILKSRFYKEGDLLVLDKGSAYIADLLLEGDNKLILDMCAAPGTKSIYLTQSIFSKYHLIAADFSLERTNEMQNLFHFYNLSDIFTLNTDSIDFPLRRKEYFNSILLDAPCTGSGTFSSNPELKWRQNPSFLHQNTILQQKLLSSAIRMLKPNGTLIYSTCSLYAEEGEMQIQRVLDQLSPQKLPKIFNHSYELNGKHILGSGRLFPAVHNSKGFFVGRFKKKP